MLEIIELNPKDYLVSIYQKMLKYLILVIKIALIFYLEEETKQLIKLGLQELNI